MPAAFRLATFNLENLGSRSDDAALDERIAVLRPQLLRLRADVLCLQEINGQRDVPHTPRRLRALDALLVETPYAGFARAVTMSESGQGPRDRHNQVTLSRFPILAQRQIRHDLLARPLLARPRDEPDSADADADAIEWDRPVLHTALALPNGRTLNILNVHLRAPRAAFIAGEKEGAERWRSTRGWAEGFFLTAVKRAGQAMETRLFIDRLFDDDPDALIAVVGDFNADDHEVPLRLVMAAEEDTGNPHLAPRALVAIERGVAESQRFSVIHHGRRQMVDHVLVSQALLGWYRRIEVHNESLGDELTGPAAAPGGPASYHAPLVAEFATP